MSGNPPVRRPAVASAERPLPAAAVASTLALVGIGVFLWLANTRAALAQGDSSLPPLAALAISTPAPLPVAAAAPVPFVPAVLPPPAFVPSIAARPAVPNDERERARAPVLIVDLAQANVPPPPPPTATGALPLAPLTDTKGVTDTERFSARVGGEEVDVVEAERLTGLDRLVPQGAIIGTVMETALNSDLPGFARALVQRDVLSFDGSAILIPAGSRVIGQYKSGVAQGASRIFIMWTRIIRPDGVSISIASPVIDDLGRGGIAGKVNRHFLQRFGGAILLSVLTGGINAAAASVGRGGSTVVVGSAGEASSLANQASGDLQIPPTITTPQGASVRIFVARDLDFTRVGPYR